MSRTVIDATKLYRNVRSGTIVKILEQSGTRASIATINNGETGRSRSVATASLHRNGVNSDGQAHTSGYVPVVDDAKPVVADIGPSNAWSDMDLLDNLDDMSDEELAALAAKHEQIKKDSAEIAEKAKVVLKARQGDDFGLFLQGKYALVFKAGEKFDAKTALRNLAREDFARILLPKPDSTQARKVFAYEPEKLAACMKDDGPSLTIRVATADDKARAAMTVEEPGLDIEDYVL